MSQAFNLIMCNKGVHDSHMHRSPNHTHFADIIKQYTLSAEWTKEILGTETGGTSGISSNNKEAYTSFNLHDTGDALSNLWIQTTIPALTAVGDADHMHLVNAAGFGCVNKIELKMGGLHYDVQDSMLMYIIYELTTPQGEKNVEETGDYRDEAILIAAAKTNQVFQIPVRMWCFGHHMSDSLKICAMGNNTINFNVYWDLLENWVVNRGQDVWDTALVTAVKQQMGQASSKLLGRYHFMEEAERHHYTNTPILSLFTTWQDNLRDLAPGTTTDVPRLSFNYPTTAFVFACRNSTWNDGNYYPLKVGTKDKFWLGNPLGTETLVDLDLKINNNSLLQGYGQNSLHLRTHAAGYGFGAKPTQPIYVLPLQKDVHLKENKASVNCSRFDNITAYYKVKYATSTSTNSVYVYAISRNLMTIDTGYVNKPLAA